MLNDPQLRCVVRGVLDRASKAERANEGLLVRRIQALWRQISDAPLPAADPLRQLLESVKQDRATHRDQKQV